MSNMADDERAAKAARAKALLKKRQQQKKTEAVASPSGSQSPTASISRTSTPGPRSQRSPSVNEDSRILPSSPPARTNSTSPVVAKQPDDVNSTPPLRRGGNAAPKKDNYSTVVQDQRQTIALLVSEKTALVESLERLEGVDSKLQSTQAELGDRFRELEILRLQLADDEESRNASLQHIRDLETQNFSLLTKLRDQERETHSARSECDSSRVQLAGSERRVKELEEQIQNDDRIDILETKLRNTQDRAEEVAAQLSKVKQAYDKLKLDHEELQKTLQDRTSSEEALRQQVTELGNKLRSSEDSLTKIASEHDVLSSKKSAVVVELQNKEALIALLNGKLSEASAELSAIVRQSDSLQLEMKQALRRAEDAEAAQRDLQEEGTGLMCSLDEMRPKIVELTSVKLELTEKVEQLSTMLRQRDNTISDLEVQLDSVQASFDESRRENEASQREREKEKKAAEAGQAELQQAYNDIQARLNDALVATREIEADRGKQRLAIARLQEELERLRFSHEARQDEVSLLRSQAEQRERDGYDEQRLLNEVQEEIETLRSKLANKEEEIARMRQVGPSSSPMPSTQSLDDEVKSAITQQLELDLSNAKSTIRSLESSLYDTEAKYLQLQKHMGAMEDELSHLQTRAQRSQALVSARHSEDIRRGSFDSQRSGRLFTSAIIDEGLPPEIRHQRHISLAMLQARMYSEAEAATHHASASKSSRSIGEQSQSHSHTTSIDSSASLRWSQFLDESHVFWCAACKGDLIVL